MAAAANYAWANQAITHFAPKSFAKIFGEAARLRVVGETNYPPERTGPTRGLISSLFRQVQFVARRSGRRCASALKPTARPSPAAPRAGPGASGEQPALRKSNIEKRQWAHSERLRGVRFVLSVLGDVRLGVSLLITNSYLPAYRKI